MTKKIKILHLENLNSDVKLVDKILKKENLDFESLVADSEDKFVKALKEFSPDIILADHFLPSFNSYDALTLLQETGLKIPFIVVTGHISEEFAADIIKSGANDYIFKDRPDRLPAAIHNALEKFSQEKQREHMIYEQAHLAAIVNASNDGIISKTLDGIITSWNISAEKLFGYPAAEVVDKNISIIIPPDRFQEESELMESMKRGESVQHFETVRLRKDGTGVNVSLSISPLKDNDGNVTGAAQIVHDITKRKKTEDALRESESNLQAIFENTSEGIILTNTKGEIKFLNKRAQEISLLNTEEKIEPGDNILDLHEAKKSNYKDIISRVLAGEVLNFDHYYVRKNGESKWFNWTKTPVYNKGKIEGICITCADITERKNAEEKILHANRLYAFISQINHTIVHVKDEKSLFDEACRIAVEQGKFKMAWVGIPDTTKGKIRLTSSSGQTRLDIKKFTEYAYEVNGPIDKTLNGQDYFVVNEIQKDPNIAWKEYAAARGFNAVICLAIKKSGNVAGVLIIYSSELNFFNAEEITLLIEARDNISFAMDIFEKDHLRAMTAHKLEQSEAMLKEAQAIAKLGSWQTDLQTFKAKWSEETHHIFGTDPTKFQATHEAFLNFTHPDDRTKVNTAFENSLNSQTINSIEHRIIATSGTEKYVIENWKVFQDGNGNPFRAVGTCQDITERKIAEIKLNSTLNELETAVTDLNEILDSSLDVICTIDANGAFIKVNAASQLVWGYTPEELIGTKFINLVYHQDVDRTLKAAEQIVSRIQVPTFENRYVHKSGRIVPILWSVNWDEKLQLTFCIAKDVTEKKRLEKAVENERDRFFDMFSKAQSAIGMLKGADHVFEMANPLYLQLTGKKDIIGKTVAEVLPEVIEQGFIAMLDNVYRTGETYIGTEKLVKVDTEGNGKMTDFYMNFVYQAYRNVEGEIEGVFFFINDITEQIISRKVIEKSEKQYRQIVETAQEGIWMIDELNNTTFVNQKLCEILEYTKDEMLGKEIYYFMDEEGKQIAAKLMQEKQRGVKGRDDFKYISKSGKEIWTSISSNPIFNDEGRYMGALAMLSDIGDRIKGEIENKFQANLLNTIGQAAIATDLNGIVNYWNRAAENIFGWTKDEALGKYIVDLTTSEASSEQAMKIMDELKKGQTWSGELKVQKKDGTDFPALVTNSPIYNECNILSGIIGISSDITEMKKLEDLLDKSNRTARIGSWEYNIITQAHYWSTITREIYEVDDDLTPDLQTAITYYKSGASRSSISNAVDKSVRDGTPWDLELQIVTAKGNELWVRDIGEAEFINGKCIRLYGSFQDIDERKKAEIENLKTYEEKNIILESIGDAFFAVDKDSIVTYWNNKAEIIMTKNREEVIGKKIFDVFNGLLDTITYKYYQAAITENKEQHYETFSKKLGKWLEVSAYPSSNGLTGYFRDITDRKLLDLQLSALNVKLSKHVNDLAISNRELEEFAYVASHDLQEPLRMVTSFLTQIEKKYGNIIDDKGKQYIHFAVDGAKRMRQIILDLLEFSRVGYTEDKQEIVDVNELPGEIVSLLRKKIEEKNAVITIGKLPILKTLRSPLRQVFQNLINNSLIYHSKCQQPEINITVKDNQKNWQFAVADNGIGIDPEYFDKIFTIFQRLHNKDEYSGTGIGLAITKKIIEGMGGKIWVESQEGKGSTFYFTIKK